MEKKEVYVKDGERLIRADVLGVKGDFYVLNTIYNDMVVHKSKIVQPTFDDGGIIDVDKDNIHRAAFFVNNITFYRYYPSDAEPFEVSYDTKNKYGFGVYFLDNDEVYKDKFKDPKLVAIKPNVKAPLILTYHKRETPSYEYKELFKKLYNAKQVKTTNDVSRELIDNGFDSLVIYETRGIYLILLKNDTSLFGITEKDIPKEELGMDEDMIAFLKVYSDNLTLHQGMLLYKFWFYDRDGIFYPAKEDMDAISDMVSKGYVKQDDELTSGYVLTEDGLELIETMSHYFE